jgi:flagellar biosynthesis protein FliQ
VDLSSSLFDALRLALWLSLPALAVCLLVTLVMSLVQSATQTSDPSVGFAPRLLAVLATLFIGRAFLSDGLTRFAAHMLQTIGQLGH